MGWEGGGEHVCVGDSKEAGLLSLRDVTSEHVPLLKHILEEGKVRLIQSTSFNQILLIGISEVNNYYGTLISSGREALFKNL